jgi:hypothetical protein
MQIEEIAKCLLVYRGVFDASMFLELLEKECAQDWGYLSWFQTTVGSDNGYSVRPDYRSSLGCELAPLYVEPENITNNRVVPLVGEWHKIAAGLEDVIWHYRNSYGIGLSSNEGYRVLKYGAGAEYRGHIDHAPDNGSSKHGRLFKWRFRRRGVDLPVDGSSNQARSRLGGHVSFQFPLLSLCCCGWGERHVD